MEAENFGHAAASDGLVVVEAAHRLRRVDQKRETVACGDTFECFPVTRPAPQINAEYRRRVRRNTSLYQPGIDRV